MCEDDHLASYNQEREAFGTFPSSGWHPPSQTNPPPWPPVSPPAPPQFDQTVKAPKWWWWPPLIWSDALTIHRPSLPSSDAPKPDGHLSTYIWTHPPTHGVPNNKQLTKELKQSHWMLWLIYDVFVSCTTRGIFPNILQEMVHSFQDDPSTSCSFWHRIWTGVQPLTSSLNALQHLCIHNNHRIHNMQINRSTPLFPFSVLQYLILWYEEE